MLKIKLLKTNNIHLKVDWNKLIVKSKLIEISNDYDYMNVNNFLVGNGYSHEVYLDYEKLREKIKVPNEFDIVIGITDFAFGDNFYVKRLSNKVALVSISTIKYILEDKIPLENFLLKCIYELSTMYSLYGNDLREYEIPPIIHEDTRRCLFDMNGDLLETLISTKNIIVCEECKRALQKGQLHEEYISNLEKELKKIKVPVYIRLREWFKQKTITALLVILGVTVGIELLANLIYDLIKNI